MLTSSSSYNLNFESVANQIEKHSFKLENSSDLDPLMDLIGDSHYVLLGEASHGTHEYYTWRTHITKRLIAEKNFSFVAVEGDWPDCYKINRYIKGYPESGSDAKKVLQTFNRWPTWMWANWEVVALAEWMHKYNMLLPLNKRIGFYGLDVYSLWESVDAIVSYLEKTDKAALRIAKKVKDCFSPYKGDEGSLYAHATRTMSASCENEVVELLAEIRRKLPLYNTDHETVFSTEQNALIAVNAERYYRAMIRSGANSWNIRDRHMVDTLNRLVHFHGENTKTIVWEHNTHIGDARATDMKREGMVNVGQLVKEQNDPNDVVCVGFGSYKGSVIASDDWGSKTLKMDLPPAKEGSIEQVLHEALHSNKLILTKNMTDSPVFSNPIGHRAVGVVYESQYEGNNYVPSLMNKRYDAFLFIDESHALYPLHIAPDGHQTPETFPWGV